MSGVGLGRRRGGGGSLCVHVQLYASRSVAVASCMYVGGVSDMFEGKKICEGLLFVTFLTSNQYHINSRLY